MNLSAAKHLRVGHRHPSGRLDQVTIRSNDAPGAYAANQLNSQTDDGKRA